MSSQVLRTSGRIPLPSAPKTSTTPPVRSESHIDVCGVARGCVDPQVAPLDLAEVAGEVRNHRDRQVLDRAGRRARDRGSDSRGPVRGDDDAACPRALGAANHRAKVARVGHLVEAREQRTFSAASSQASAYL